MPCSVNAGSVGQVRHEKSLISKDKKSFRGRLEIFTKQATQKNYQETHFWIVIYALGNTGVDHDILNYMAWPLALFCFSRYDLCIDVCCALMFKKSVRNI